MKVYIVGHDGPEHNHIEGIRWTYKSALQLWNKVRIDMICEAEKNNLWGHKSPFHTNMYDIMIKKLQCEDPKLINCYPQETPYIQEWEVLE